jgi:hypothetical protein
MSEKRMRMDSAAKMRKRRIKTTGTIISAIALG